MQIQSIINLCTSQKTPFTSAKKVNTKTKATADREVYEQNYEKCPIPFVLKDVLYIEKKKPYFRQETPEDVAARRAIFRDDELFDISLEHDLSGYDCYDDDDLEPIVTQFYNPVDRKYYKSKGYTFSENKWFMPDTDIAPRDLDSPLVDINYAPDVDIDEKYPELRRTEIDIPEEEIRQASELKYYGKNVFSPLARKLIVNKLYDGYDIDTIKTIKNASILTDWQGNDKLSEAMFNDGFISMETRKVSAEEAAKILKASVFKNSIGNKVYSQPMYRLITELNETLPVNDAVKYALRAKVTTPYGFNYLDSGKARTVARVVSTVPPKEINQTLKYYKI